jgi:cell division protein ZapB
MDNLLASLECKVEEIIAFCDALRAENRRLRERIHALEEEKRALAERMTIARARLENLLEKLPAETTHDG